MLFRSSRVETARISIAVIARRVASAPNANSRTGSFRVAHRIAANEIDSELAVLWFREMFSGAYRPCWVDAEIEGGGPRRAVTFAVNKAHPRYEGVLDDAIIAERIATGEGFLGTNRDYLYRTVERLSEMGVTDGPLHGIAARVRDITKEGSTP